MAQQLMSGWEGGAEHQAWLDVVGKTGEAPNHSAVYRMRLAGPTPHGLKALPKDPRPVNAERGAAILAGRWRFGSAVVETPPDHAPWGPPFPTPHFADRVHRFDWLRDVAARGATGEARARALTASWVEAFGKWDAFAWRTSVTADRVINLLSAGPWLLSGLQGAWREELMDSLARQIRHLAASGGDEPDPASRFRIAVALCLAGAVVEDCQRFLEDGLAELDRECAAQILADGGHIGRSPQMLAEALMDIHVVEEVLLRLGHSPPAFLRRLQPRMSAMLAFFTLPGGNLLPANGGGDGEGKLSAAAQAPYGAVEAKFAFARLSGYQRIQAEELTLYMDAAGAPDRPFAVRTHAGALAISVYDGPEAIVTSCGSGGELEPVLADAARRTGAHSVMTMDGADSATFSPDQQTGTRQPVGPAGLAVRRLEENDQFLLEGQHAGWRVRHGLIYRRRLYIARNGGRITGEESLFRPVAETFPAGAGPVPFEIRFHLHPDVEIAPGPDDRTLFLGLPNRQRVWRFRCETALSVEDSRYWGGLLARQARQLVVRGRAEPDSDGSNPPNRVRWALSRLEPAV
jgi:uncharacterized heparinase superfamily protein